MLMTLNIEKEENSIREEEIALLNIRKEEIKDEEKDMLMTLNIEEGKMKEEIKDTGKDMPMTLNLEEGKMKEEILEGKKIRRNLNGIRYLQL